MQRRQDPDPDAPQVRSGHADNPPPAPCIALPCFRDLTRGRLLLPVGQMPNYSVHRILSQSQSTTLNALIVDVTRPSLFTRAMLVQNMLAP